MTATAPGGPAVRPMRSADLEAAADLSAAAFEFDISDPGRRRRWLRRIAHSLHTDPGGSFVSLDGERVTGVAQAIRRGGRVWILSLLTVDPRTQSAGAGRALVSAAREYAQPGDHGLIVSSEDPRAMRLYALAGFALHPAVRAVGRVDRRALPAPDRRIRAFDDGDLERIAAIAAEVRGADYTLELPQLLEDRGTRITVLADRGYLIGDERHPVWALGARDEESAEALLVHALAGADPEPAAGEDEPSVVGWITGAQQWAIQSVLRAGLLLKPCGALCVRGTPGTLHPFLPSGPFA